jgi:tight adherence protein B
MDYLFYLFVVLFFIAVTLLLEGVMIWWNTTRGPEAQRVARRVRLMSAGMHKDDGDGPTLLKKRLLAEAPALARVLLQVPRVHQIDRLLEQSGLSWTVSRFLGFSLLSAIVGFYVGMLLQQILVMKLAIAVICGSMPMCYVLRKRQQRLLKFEELLPEALDLIGRALRAGHAFPSALKMVGDEMVPPIANEFRITFEEVNYGISMQAALTNLATRVPSLDLRYFVIAVLIQRETGGNLSEILDNISMIIRERLKLLGKVRVLSAEGRMSAWVLGLLPFGTALVINLVNPKFMAVLWTDPAGQRLMVVAGTMIVIGVIWMRKIIRIHV